VINCKDTEGLMECELMVDGGGRKAKKRLQPLIDANQALIGIRHTKPTSLRKKQPLTIYMRNKRGWIGNMKQIRRREN